MTMILKTAVVSIAALAIVTGSPVRAAGSAADFYKGKTVTLLVAFGAGGGFGLYSRLLAEHMSAHIPGKPSIQLQFMPGAGGLKAANYFYNVSPRDGSVMAILSQTGALFQRLERGMKSNIKYDLSKMNYLGRLVTMEAGFVGRVESGLTSIEALKSGKVKPIACAAGKAHQGYINAKSFSESLGFPVQIIVGYPGSKDQMLAFERDECNLLVLSISTWETRGKYLIEKGFAKPLAVVNLERSPFWPKIPTTPELAQDEESKQVLEFIAAYGAIGRAYMLPPETPQHLVAAMQKAFVATYKDPKLVAVAKKRSIPMNPATAETVKKYVMKTLNAPEQIVQKTRDMLEYRPGS